MTAPRARALTEADCPHPDDALWWNGFAIPDLGGDVRALAEDGGDLVVGGTINVAGLQKSLNVARWDGSHYQPFGADLPLPCEVLSRVDGNLVAGCKTYVAGTPEAFVYEYDGSEWRALGTMNALGAAGQIYSPGEVVPLASSRDRARNENGQGGAEPVEKGRPPGEGRSSLELRAAVLTGSRVRASWPSGSPGSASPCRDRDGAAR